RVKLARGHPESPLRVEVHLDRLGQQRVGREQVHLEAWRDDERLALQFGVGVRHLGIALGDRGGGDEGEHERVDVGSHGEGFRGKPTDSYPWAWSDVIWPGPSATCRFPLRPFR